MTTINFKDSIADPPARDIGNQVAQGRIASVTKKFSLFTTNANATWRGNTLLQKQSYPFAKLRIPVNRNHFRLQVGDVFKYSDSKYGISNMVCRVLSVQEANLESENIILNVIQDPFSVSKAITEYTAPTDSATPSPDYTPVAFTEQTVYEAPYVLTESVEVIPLAKREIAKDLGIQTHLSLDGGSSYLNVGQVNNIQPYGTLQAEYGETYAIDPTGIEVDFPTSDINTIDTITWAETLSGESNILLIDDEIMTFQTITPVSGTVYALSNIIRGRFGTQQAVHSADADVWVVSKSIGMINHSELIAGSSRKFKLLPFNSKYVGNIADATVIDVTPSGKAKTPYIPANFCCNDVSFASRYASDCVLTWNGRKRGEGAGIGTPGTILATGDLEGYFDIEVYVSSVLVRTEADVTTETWTYTSAMNISDNGSLASEIEFRITNHRTEGGYKYESDYVSLTVKLDS